MSGRFPVVRSALIYIATVLAVSWLLPDLHIAWRICIAIAIAALFSFGLRMWRDAAIMEWTRRLPDGSTASVGEHVFTREHGYWSDGEQALDDNQLVSYAIKHGDGSVIFSLAGASDAAHHRSEE